MHSCYPHLPLEPGANFPSDVRDDGAFPAEPYDFSFWGFPCVKHSSLNHTATEADLVDALDLLEHALRRLSENPPAVFVLENTHSLLSGPRWVLARITSMLRRLPYDWRHPSPTRAPPLPRSPCRAPPAAPHAPRSLLAPTRSGVPSYAPVSTSAPGRPALDYGGWGTSALPPYTRSAPPSPSPLGPPPAPPCTT